MSKHVEYFWNKGEPAGRSCIGICVEGKCGAELQMCNVDPAEFFANLERACGHWCNDNYGPYVPDCPTWLPPGTYRMAEGYEPGDECAIIAVRHIECDQVVVNVGCPSVLSDGGGGGGGTCTVNGPIDVTLTGPIEITGTVDVNIVGPDPLTVTGDVTVTPAAGVKFDMNLCAIDPDLPPIPVVITNPEPPGPDFEYGCASDDGRVIVSIAQVVNGAVVISLVEADGVTPVPAGVVMGPCAADDWESIGPKKICVKNAVDQLLEGYCLFTLINTADTTQTITVMLDDQGNVVPAGTVSVTDCPDEGCPPLIIKPDVIATAGDPQVVFGTAYGYVCIDVPCDKRSVVAGQLVETEVSDDTVVTVEWTNGHVDILKKGERCCRDARGLCPLTGEPRVIQQSFTATVISGDGCAVISGDL